jgi:hypothetical protein
MKKLMYTFIAIVTLLFALSGVTIQAQTAVDQWGFYGSGAIGGWTFTPGTAAGSATISGTAVPTAWTILRGGFPTITPTTDAAGAAVVTGKVKFTGTIESWSALRFGLFYSETAGTVTADATPANGDSTRWNGSTGNNYGYLFVPYSGTNNAINWNAGNPKGNASQGGIWNRPVNSTNNQGNNYILGGEILPKPARAKLIAGTYDFAISVQPKANGTSELRFFLTRKNSAGTKIEYWFGGTLTDTVTWRRATKFNSITFGLNNGNGNDFVREMAVSDVQAGMGAPITVPEAPWEPYYIDQWGFYTTAAIGGWSFVADPDGVIGNAGIKGTTNPTAWTILRGGFVEPITPTTTKALKVTGKVTFTGTIESWSALRYGLFYSDSAGTVIKDATPANGDSTRWSGNNTHNYGYLFVPYSGTNSAINWNAGNPKGNSTQGGLWNRPVNSTNNQGNNYILGGEILPKPARAKLIAGTYDFAMSVQALANGNSELRFYLIRQGATQADYWFGGVLTDTVTWRKATKFNSITFGLNNGNGNDFVREMALTDVQVDIGAPIVVPDAPFTAFYIKDWGFIGGRTGDWTLTPQDLIGNVSVAGTASPKGWVALRGGFDASVQLIKAKALRVTGKMELVGGGFEAWSSLRLGLFNKTGIITLDSTTWQWSGDDAGHSGYLFIPQSGTNDLTEWQAISKRGTVGAVINSPWLSTSGTKDYVLSNELQQSPGAIGGAGIYDFAFSFAPQADGSTEIRYDIHKAGYTFSGIVIDNNTPIAASEFSCFNIAINNPTITGINLTDVYVNRGDPIIITDVATSSESIPMEYALSQNYPNPFNPTTTINFALPKSGNVSLIVYDVLGRAVANLVNGNLNAGQHTVKFDASKLSSGVYFYRLSAGDFVSVKKLMLLK